MNDHRAALKKNLFDLPTGWSWHWLTDVISIQGGTQPPANTFSSVPLPGYVRLVQIRDFETDAHVTFIPDSKKWRKCGEEDILIARYGAALGRICKGLSGAYNVALAKVVPSNSVDSGFIYQLLRSSFFQDPVLAMGGRSAQAGFNKDGLSVIPVPIPPLPEQRAIAATLGALDDKIELNRKMNATLEAMARALFRDWFVDFGPTRAKMEGGKSYLSPELWSLFPDRLDSDGKPEGWEAGTLGSVAMARSQGVSPSDFDADTPYIGLEHMPRGSIALTEWESASKVSSNKAAFKAGDFLFGKLRPYFHKVGIAPVSGICSTDIVVLRSKVEDWSGFVIACISDADFVAYTDKTSTGTKMPRTSWSIMAKYPLILPPPAVAEAFNATVAPLLAKIRANIHESRILAQTRDLLLPRLMSGELRVEMPKGQEAQT